MRQEQHLLAYRHDIDRESAVFVWTGDNNKDFFQGRVHDIDDFVF